MTIIESPPRFSAAYDYVLSGVELQTLDRLRQKLAEHYGNVPGDSIIDNVLRSAKRQNDVLLVKMTIAAERERCAQIVDAANRGWTYGMCQTLVKAIRGGQP